MKQKGSCFLLIVFFSLQAVYAQEEVVLIVIPNQDSKIIIDGVEKGNTKTGAAFRVLISPGEHYVEAQSTSGVTKGEILQLEAGKQKIHKVEFDIPVQSTPNTEIIVANLNFNLPGTVTVLTWQSDNKGMSYSYPQYYFAFDKGDEIVIDVSMTNKNGTNLLEVATYPNNVVKYTNKSFGELKNLRIKVEDRSIYRFTFATNHAFDRNCIVKLSRQPGSSQSINFNPNVSKQKIYRPVAIVEPTAQRVNSTSNEEFKGGRSRILVPVTIPPNTVEWFYRFSASRNQEDIDNVRKNFQLFGELAQLLLTASGAGIIANKAVGIGVDQLSMPPGSNHCDIFLLDYENINGFESNTNTWKYIIQGSRQNLMSGNVKIDCCNSGQYYLGLRNRDYADGVNVSIEVIAITAVEEFVMDAK